MDSEVTAAQWATWSLEMTGPSTEKLCWGANRLDLRHHDYRVLGVFLIHRQNKGKAANLRGLSRSLWSP